jgi:hypothetical protein
VGHRTATGSRWHAASKEIPGQLDRSTRTYHTDLRDPAERNERKHPSREARLGFLTESRRNQSRPGLTTAPHEPGRPRPRRGGEGAGRRSAAAAREGC